MIKFKFIIMGCKQCKSFGQTPNGEVEGVVLTYEPNQDKEKLENSNLSLSREFQIELPVETGLSEDVTQIFRTKKNDIKKFKKEEIEKQASRISQLFLVRHDRVNKNVQFDSGKFEKGLMRLVEMNLNQGN